MFGHYCMLHSGVIINYAESVETVAADMEHCRPTLMASVPRLYEKIYARVLERGAEQARGSGSSSSSGPRVWARSGWSSGWSGRRVSPALALQHWLADHLVFAKLRARTGGRIRFFISGGAPLLGRHRPVLPRRGHADPGGVRTHRDLTGHRGEHLRASPAGHGGPARFPEVEVTIAPDGEILTRGPNVMAGYYKKPEATAEALDADGWFHTGDIGLLDPDGFLKITDRKKDLIVTAGGKNIAPQPIEGLVKTSKFVSSAVMLGDRRRFPIMLMVPNFEHPVGVGRAAGDPGHRRRRRWCAAPEVQEKMDREVRTTLRDLASFEMPKKLLLLPRDFRVEAGELTPTLKVKRRVVELRYREAIEKLYGEERA